MIILLFYYLLSFFMIIEFPVNTTNHIKYAYLTADFLNQFFTPEKANNVYLQLTYYVNKHDFLKNQRITIDLLAQWKEHSEQSNQRKLVQNGGSFYDLETYVEERNANKREYEAQQSIISNLSLVFGKACLTYYNDLVKPDIELLQQFTNENIDFEMCQIKRHESLKNSFGEYGDVRLKVDNEFAYYRIKEKFKTINIPVFLIGTEYNEKAILALPWLMIPRLEMQLKKLGFVSKPEQKIDTSIMSTMTDNVLADTKRKRLEDEAKSLLWTSPTFDYKTVHKQVSGNPLYQCIIDKLIQLELLPQSLQNELFINTKLENIDVTSIDFPPHFDFEQIRSIEKNLAYVGLKNMALTACPDLGKLACIQFSMKPQALKDKVEGIQNHSCVLYKR